MGVEEILFDTLKLNTKELKYFKLLSFLKNNKVLSNAFFLNRDKMKLKEQKISNKEFQRSTKQIKFIF